MNKETGYVLDTKVMKDMIRKHIIERFDHRNLNIDADDFQNLIPSAENIAVVIWNILRRHIDRSLELQVILYETERNFVEYSGD